MKLARASGPARGPTKIKPDGVPGPGWGTTKMKLGSWSGRGENTKMKLDGAPLPDYILQGPLKESAWGTSFFESELGE